MKRYVAGLAASSAIVLGVAVVYVLYGSTEASQQRHLRGLQPSLTREESIVWIDNYREAIAQAKRTGKPIFLEFRCAP